VPTPFGGTVTSARHVFVVAFVLVFLMIEGWSLASPPFGGPDEPNHVARAVALVHGELTGKTLGFGIITTSVPRVYTVTPNCRHCYLFTPSGDAMWPCFAFWDNIPASCQQLRQGAGPVTTETNDYPPLYYAIVGVPSLVVTSTTGLYLIRLLSGLVSSIFIALAIMTVFAWSKSRLLFLGVLLAVTPMTLFMASVVNPSGLEISTGFCLWCSGLVLTLENADAPPAGLVAVMTASAAALLLIRPVSALWVALTLGILILLAGPRVIIGLLRQKIIRRGALFVVVAGLLAFGWAFHFAAVGSAPAGQQLLPGTTNVQIIVKLFGETGGWLKQMVGIFGWLDTSAPLYTYVVWGIAVGLVLLVALAVSRLRQSAALVLLIALVIVVPVMFGYGEARNVGIDFWESRYILPLAVGIPLVATVLVDRSGVVGRLHARLTVLVCCAIGSANFLAFAEALRRNTVGVSGPIDYLNGSWSPPFGSPAVTLFYLVTTVLFVWFLGRLSVIAGRNQGPIGRGSLVDTDRSSPSEVRGEAHPSAALR